MGRLCATVLVPLHPTLLPLKTNLEVLFTPADFYALAQRDLGRTTCVVLDILRATTTMLTALANGAQAIVPAEDIPEALERHRQQPDSLLAGERNGLRIRADLTGGIEFDLGNSPREFTPERVRGRTIIMTTTNGTRALRACAKAQRVMVGAFLNLGAVAATVQQHFGPGVLIVCSGTLDQASLEDTLAAGALCDLLWSGYQPIAVADSAQLARELYLAHRGHLLAAMRLSRNGRRLLNAPALRDDVPFCLQRDTIPRAAILEEDGAVRLAGSVVSQRSG